MVTNLNLMKLMEFVSANDEICQKFAAFIDNSKAAIQHYTMYKIAKTGGRPSEICKMMKSKKMSPDVSIGSLWDDVEKHMHSVAADLKDLNEMTQGSLIRGTLNPMDFSNLTECISKVKNFLWNTRRMQMEDYSGTIFAG